MMESGSECRKSGSRAILLVSVPATSAQYPKENNKR